MPGIHQGRKEQSTDLEDKQRKASPLFLLNFTSGRCVFNLQDIFHSLIVPFFVTFCTETNIFSDLSEETLKLLLMVVCICVFNSLFFPVLCLISSGIIFILISIDVSFSCCNLSSTIWSDFKER